MQHSEYPPVGSDQSRYSSRGPQCRTSFLKILNARFRGLRQGELLRTPFPGEVVRRINLLRTWANRDERPSSSNSAPLLSEVSPLRSNASLVFYSSVTLHQTSPQKPPLHAR